MPWLADSLCGLAGGVYAAVVAQVTGYGYANTARKCVTLIAIDAIAILNAQCLVPLANGIGSAKD